MQQSGANTGDSSTSSGTKISLALPAEACQQGSAAQTFQSAKRPRAANQQQAFESKRSGLTSWQSPSAQRAACTITWHWLPSQAWAANTKGTTLSTCHFADWVRCGKVKGCAKLNLLAAQGERVSSDLEGSSCMPYQHSHGLKMSYSGECKEQSHSRAHRRRQLILAHGFALGSCLAPHVVCKAVPVGLFCCCARRARSVPCICGRLSFCWSLPGSSLHSGDVAAGVCRSRSA